MKLGARPLVFPPAVLIFQAAWVNNAARLKAAFRNIVENVFPPRNFCLFRSPIAGAALFILLRVHTEFNLHAVGRKEVREKVPDWD